MKSLVLHVSLHRLATILSANIHIYVLTWILNFKGNNYFQIVTCFTLKIVLCTNTEYYFVYIAIGIQWLYVCMHSLYIHIGVWHIYMCICISTSFSLSMCKYRFLVGERENDSEFWLDVSILFPGILRLSLQKIIFTNSVLKKTSTS